MKHKAARAQHTVGWERGVSAAQHVDGRRAEPVTQGDEFRGAPQRVVLQKARW